MDNHEDLIYSIHASFCGALANEKRLRILHLLGSGERAVHEIAADVGITPSNASQHLRIMRNLGLVRVHKEGTQAYYRLTSEKFSEGYRLIRKVWRNCTLQNRMCSFLKTKTSTTYQNDGLKGGNVDISRRSFLGIVARESGGRLPEPQAFQRRQGSLRKRKMPMDALWT